MREIAKTASRFFSLIELTQSPHFLHQHTLADTIIILIKE